jgi:hypothetical protein
MNSLFVNTLPYYIRDLSILRFWYLQRVLRSSPPWISMGTEIIDRLSLIHPTHSLSNVYQNLVC